MTDQEFKILKEDKLKSLEDQIEKEKITIQSLNGQLRARQIQGQELFEQSAQLRTSILLLEEALHKSQLNVHMLTERVKSLEKEKEELISSYQLESDKFKFIKLANYSTETIL